MLGQVAESILESKGRGHVMGAGFWEMGKEILKNKIGKIENQNIWSLGENVYKIEIILKKGRWLCAIIAHDKLLE